MRLPEKSGFIDEERSTQLIRTAIESGVNYLDTAWLYHRGQSEVFLGKALQDGYRKKVRLATKLPHWLVKNRQDMDSFLNIQLNRLQTDHIDYYLIHSLTRESWHRMKELGVTGFLDAAKRDGRIVNAGFSFHDDTTSFKEVINEYDWGFCQIQYNILDEHHQAGVEGLKYAAEKNLAVIIMEPLLGGKLAQNIPKEVQAVWDEAEVKRKPAEWALLWLWNHPEITVVLSGMNDETHLFENLRTASYAYPGSLTKADMTCIRKAVVIYQSLKKIPCTGCGYCMPCPYGVDIPTCFDIYNTRHMFRDQRYVWFLYAKRVGGVLGTITRASLCRNCNTCARVCPQNIHIPGKLQDVAHEFEGVGFRLLVALAQIFLPVIRHIELVRNRRLK